MTASFPVPRDTFPDDPDGAVGEGQEPSAVHSSPRNSNAPRAPRVPRSNGRGKAPRAASPVRPAPDPGPPPPLPADLVKPESEYPGDIVIPPRPPLPVRPEPVREAPEPPAAPDSRVEVSEPFVAPELDEEDAETFTAVRPKPEAAEAFAAPESAVTAAEPLVTLERNVEPTAAAAAAPALDSAPVLPLSPDEAEVDSAPEAALESLLAASSDAHESVDPFAASVILDEGADTAPAALVLRGVGKRFGDTRAVDGIDLTVPAGTFYGLVGPNGAGKTTTLSLISGLLRPDKGSIRVGGVDAASHPARAKRLMGVLPDRLRTFDRLTGRQLLYYYGVLRGLPSSTVESRIADLARAFDLTDALGRTMSDYSAGMAKKVMLAGALIHSPRLLVLDEPFESVDPVSSAVILDILSAYVAHGGTVILSSHGMELVERVCTRVAVMVAGQVLAEGTVDEVRGELTLEQRFVELAGGLSDVEGLEWLHTFSD